MKYARHGHSACDIAGSYILVTGSWKDHNKAPFRAEIYDTQLDKWF
jgi:hypothetical protein